MAEVKIIYWSGTGNTAAMAQSVADGVTAAGAEAKIIPVENAGAADIADVKAFALGCPSMGAEQLEESSMEPFVEGRFTGRFRFLQSICREWEICMESYIEAVWVIRCRDILIM